MDTVQLHAQDGDTTIPQDHQPESTPHATSERQENAPGHHRSRRLMVALAGGVVLLVAASVGYLYWDESAHFETTDDAFIAARQFAISPKVSGYITAVAVTDNEHVRAGEVLARLDDRDYRTALALTESQVAAAQAQIANIEAQMAVQQAQVTQNEAQVEQAQAALAFGQEEAARYATLARKDAGSIQDSQRYTSQRMQQQATKKMAQATFLAAGRKLAVLKAQHESAEANLAQANAQRAQAELNLSNTIITAAQPGRIVQLSAGVGQYAQPGTNLSMFVPDEIWVTANFKETQLRAIRPGQAATIKMDVQPGRIIRGHVESVQPGSGTAFSLLPAENATGNYVKIVQRVPVKIALEAPPEKIALGPGMSVEPTVRINPEQTLLERLGAFL